MKTRPLTKKMIAASQSDKILFLPRFWLIISITFLILLLYFDIFFHANTDRWLYLAMIVVGILSTIFLIVLKRYVANNTKDEEIIIMVDTVVDKKMKLSFSKYSQHKFFVIFAKVGVIQIEDIIKYSKYKVNDQCFLVRFKKFGQWSVYNCKTYVLPDELKPYLVSNDIDAI